MKNPFDEILETEDTKNKTESTAATAANLFTHKPFYLRWYKFKNASVAISYLCQLLSPLTCFAVFFFLFLEPLNFIGSPFSFILSAAISLCLAIGIEVLKRYSTTNALIEWFNYKGVNFAFYIAASCSLVSIGTSFWGAYILPQKLTSPPIASVPILQNIEHLQNSLIASVVSKKETIEAKKVEIKEYEKNYKSSSANRLSRRVGVKAGHNNLTAQLHTLEKDLGTIQANQPNAIKEAIQGNKDAITGNKSEQTTLTTNHTKENQSKGLILGYVSLFLEGTFWFTMLFVFHYYKKANIELNGESNSKSGKSASKVSKSEQKQAESKSAIGFLTHKSEGDISRNTIAYMKADESLKYYTSAQLTSMITEARNKGKEGRALKFEELKKQLKTALA